MYLNVFFSKDATLYRSPLPIKASLTPFKVMNTLCARLVTNTSVQFLSKDRLNSGNFLASAKSKIAAFLLLKQWKEAPAIAAFRASNKIQLEALLLLHVNFYRPKELGLLWLETERNLKCTQWLVGITYKSRSPVTVTLRKSTQRKW